MTTNREPERQGYHHGDLRRALLAAAEEELAEKGPEGFTLRGCAKRAGVSHAAPAHHFGDVAGLLSALAAEGFERFLKATAARMDNASPSDAEARLVAMGLGYIDFARANPALFSLMFSSRRAEFDDPALNNAATASFNQLVAGVSAVTEADALATKEGRRRLAATWAIVHGMSHLLLSHRMRFLEELGPEELEEEVVAIVSRVLD